MTIISTPSSIVSETACRLPGTIQLCSDIVALTPERYRLFAGRGRTAELSGPGSGLLARLLRHFDGTRQTSRILTTVAPLDRAAVGALLRRLLDHGMARALPMPLGRPAHLAVVGDGPLATRLCTQLSRRHRVERYAEPMSTTHHPVNSGDGPPRHWVELADEIHDLVVLAPDGAPDPALVWLLSRSRAVHLPVSAQGGHAAVEPLVVPGITRCLQCHSTGIHETGHAQRVDPSEAAIPAPETVLDWVVPFASAVVSTALRSGRPTPGTDELGRSWRPERPAPGCACCGNTLRADSPGQAA